MAGNIGATLDDTWATGGNGNDEEDEEAQFSEYPFAIGLMDDHYLSDEHPISENGKLESSSSAF